MNTFKNPRWWTKEYDSAWERVKAAMRRDWDQTKHDFGGDEPDTNQDVDDTVMQAAGKQTIPPRGMPTYEDVEPAYRFGYGARRYYGDNYSDWNSEIETKLHDDWRDTSKDADAFWDRDRIAMRRGWDYDESETTTTITGQQKE